jgi:uncharacterized protein with FMN-binding domain
MTTHPLLVTTAGGLLGLAVAWPFAQNYTDAGAASAATGAAGTASVQAVPAPTGAASRQASASAPAARRLVATGPVVPNRYGPVQVKATVVVTGSALRIAAVTALQLPSGGQSGAISGRAGPQLRHEALTAQSANLQTVSGASYTSDGYRRSLQGALDAASKAAGR